MPEEERDVSASKARLFTTVANRRRTDFQNPASIDDDASSIDDANDDRSVLSEMISARSLRGGPFVPPPSRAGGVGSAKRPRDEDEVEERSASKRVRPSSPSIREDSIATRHATYVQTEKRREKIGYVTEIRRMNAEFPKFKSDQKFTLRNSHEELEFEYQRLKMSADCEQSVVFMNSALKMFFTGVEMVNGRFLNWFELDGLSKHMNGDINGGRFSPALSRVYRRVWRKGTINPFVELGLALISSIAMYHMRQKFLPKPSGGGGGGGGSRRSAPYEFSPFASSTHHNVPPPKTETTVRSERPSGPMRRPSRKSVPDVIGAASTAAAGVRSGSKGGSGLMGSVLGGGMLSSVIGNVMGNANVNAAPKINFDRLRNNGITIEEV